MKNLYLDCLPTPRKKRRSKSPELEMTLGFVKRCCKEFTKNAIKVSGNARDFKMSRSFWESYGGGREPLWWRHVRMATPPARPAPRVLTCQKVLIISKMVNLGKMGEFSLCTFQCLKFLPWPYRNWQLELTNIFRNNPDI